MPIYRYRCECGKEFEAIRSVEKREEAPCLACGRKGKHLISAPHFDPKMGLDPAFATFSDKWAKSREKASKERA
jgi:putative FmdB family regulatory protein